MKKAHASLFSATVIATVLVLYGRWFGPHVIIGGDWPYAFEESLSRFSLWPQAWFPLGANGLGGIHPVLGLYTFQSFLIVVFTQWIGVPWVFVYKILWFGLFLFLSIFSTQKLLAQLGIKHMVGSIGSLIYAANSYALMMVTGGQMGVALAYSIAPLVLSSFIALIGANTKFEVRNSKQISNSLFAIRYSLVAGLILGLHMLWDPRFAYMTLIAIGLYYVLQRRNMLFVGLAGVVALMLNAFWVLPLALLRNNPLDSMGAAYTTIAALKFFSFADFSHALSLLSPNWPENIFGKTYFLQPEFLIIPILAFGSLLFINSKSEERNSKQIPNSPFTILFFSLLALVSVFLAKGSNPPFGDVYIWLFEHVPGFVVFRDSTKFYTLIALCYSVLIPMSMMGFVTLMKEKKKVLFLGASYFILIPFLFFWLFSIRQATMWQLGGTFTKREIPSEYTHVKDLLVADNTFNRTLWVPRQSRFTYISELHPAVEATPLFAATNAAELGIALAAPDAEQKLMRLGIKRVFVQYDALAEWFLEDRKYSERVRDEWLAVLNEVPWLTRVQDGTIAIYETRAHNDLFWTRDSESVQYRQISPSHYQVAFASAGESMSLYFSQTFHPGWVARYGDTQIYAVKTDDNLMQFVLPRADEVALDVYFTPQRYVDIGVVISLLTLGGTLLGMVLVGRAKGRV